MFGPMELGGGVFFRSVGVVVLTGNGFVEFTVAMEKRLLIRITKAQP